MKEYSNTNVTGKVHCTPVGAGDNSCTYDQQLPIKIRKERLQQQVLIEKKTSPYGWYFFQHNRPVPV